MFSMLSSYKRSHKHRKHAWKGVICMFSNEIFLFWVSTHSQLYLISLSRFLSFLFTISNQYFESFLPQEASQNIIKDLIGNIKAEKLIPLILAQRISLYSQSHAFFYCQPINKIIKTKPLLDGLKAARKKRKKTTLRIIKTLEFNNSLSFYTLFFTPFYCDPSVTKEKCKWFVSLYVCQPRQNEKRPNWK